MYYCFYFYYFLTFNTSTVRYIRSWLLAYLAAAYTNLLCATVQSTRLGGMALQIVK